MRKDDFSKLKLAFAYFSVANKLIMLVFFCGFFCGFFFLHTSTKYTIMINYTAI